MNAKDLKSSISKNCWRTFTDAVAFKYGLFERSVIYEKIITTFLTLKFEPIVEIDDRFNIFPSMSCY